MTNLNELTAYTDQLLQIELFNDYCPNGLQVQGKEKITKIVSGVTACQALIDAAIAAHADLLLVHHGFFWKGEPESIVGMKALRIGALMRNQINLSAYHLPLDAHLTLGNNIQLAKLLEIPNSQALAVDKIPNLFWLGEFSSPQTIESFANRIETKLKRKPLIEVVNPTIKRIAWCTGGAQDYIFHAINNGCDTFLTGEVSERTIHIARENNINFIAAGHHATERYGVQALGNHLAEKFGLSHQFIDIDNPV